MQNESIRINYNFNRILLESNSIFQNKMKNLINLLLNQIHINHLLFRIIKILYLILKERTISFKKSIKPVKMDIIC